jgi:hypothetical protein
MTETELIRQIKDYLDMKQVFYIRLNSGAFRTPTGAMYKMASPGTPDLIIVNNGVKWVECKVGKNTQSGSQKIFQKRLEKAGGSYFVVRSLEDLLFIL